MLENLKLNKPLLVAVWPGMGHVALNAGIYLLAKLGMNLAAEYEVNELFDVDQVEVKDGIIQIGKRPRNRFFIWRDPKDFHDLIVFLGEAQPPVGKYPFCRQIIGYAKQLGVERVFTFAAMATRMQLGQRSRVFAASTDRTGLDELKRLELDVLEDGNIGGLNGVLLSAAAEAGLPGSCLLGEMPHIFAQLPFPKASLAVLEAFSTLARIDLDLTELTDQAKGVEQQLGELLGRLEDQYSQQPQSEDEEAISQSAAEEEWSEKIEKTEKTTKTSNADLEHIEELFKQVVNDRARAFELKQELDRLGVFKDYEDRFLDLFKKPG